MSLKIVRDKSFLRKPTSPVLTVAEGEEIANMLLEALSHHPFGVGLSANQIGIQKSVSVIRLPNQDPIILMNPEIVGASQTERVIYREGCLSLPGKIMSTNRFLKVDVATLNHANVLKFGPSIEPITSESLGKDFELLKCIVAQHEIDHLNGKLITDDGVRYDTQVKVETKYGRNDMVMIEKDGETQRIKYKKALLLIESDGWKLI